jgi:hypothetical protein
MAGRGRRLKADQPPDLVGLGVARLLTTGYLPPADVIHRAINEETTPMMTGGLTTTIATADLGAHSLTDGRHCIASSRL